MNDLTTVTVKLNRQSYLALIDAAEVTGDSKTDTINRALQLYALLMGAKHIGERVFLGHTRRRAAEMKLDWFDRTSGGAS